MHGLIHRGICALLLALAALTTPAAAAVKVGYYKLPAAVDRSVLAARRTELWAKVWAPDQGKRFPLVVFLHGNHATCGHFDATLGVRVDDNSQYTNTGTCPAGYVVTPNHTGYAYLANRLASLGYLVVSINANRGINAGGGVAGDAGLNLARGRLVLRHLQQLRKWNAGLAATPATVGFSLAGKIDFAHVGLMGHSRGGEGVRAALVQYKDPGSRWPARIATPVHFEGIFEIGPVDGQTSRVLDALHVPWTVLLPGCDGDVFDLEGVKPFDRMTIQGAETSPVMKSTFEVFGANHNFYNTQWQLSDSSGCDGQQAIFPQLLGSPDQQQTALVPLEQFVTANVGRSKLPDNAKLFDPSYPLPTALTSLTQFARGYAPPPSAGSMLVVDDFDNATGTSSGGFANQSSGLAGYAHGDAGFSHDGTQRAANLDWSASGGFLQSNVAAAGAGIDVTAFTALEFRVGLRCAGTLCSSAPAAGGDVDFSIALADGSDVLSAPVALKDYAVVRRPVGSSGWTNEVMQTVRIPLSAFTGTSLGSFRGVRFTFNKTAAASLYLANVRLDKQAPGPGGLAPAAVASAIVKAAASGAADHNTIVVLGQARSVQSGVGAGAMEIEVRSNRAFPVSDALPVLRIGGKTFRLSRFGDSGGHSLIFTLTPSEYASLGSGQPAEVQVGGAPRWSFGAFRKR